MGKMKRRYISLKWSFSVYLTVCFFIAFAGSMAIGFVTNDLQEYYRGIHSDVKLFYHSDDDVKIFIDDEQNINSKYLITDNRPLAERKYMIMYCIISYAQFILVPLWIISCVAVTGIVFYRRELQKPIRILLDASQKISENQLEFKIEYQKQNELGKLCTAFDDMRQSLDENNREMWHSLEERKRLNSACSHDLRTPLTVLRGYNDFMRKYIGDISEDKINEILSKMDSQINRLENYTYKMSALHKLEDIVPDISAFPAYKLEENFSESGKYICKDKKFTLDFNSDTKNLFIDYSLVMEVYENIISNAQRYAESEIKSDVSVNENRIEISVCDDGKGFSETSLKLAKQPFYRDDKEQNTSHFGLGLYICKIICEKCGGTVDISNTESGGKVTAIFFSESR
ncbi:MAG: HAMP domain-containing histidine kinase [Ruminococcus sp.]|nr:HAMP domain-containing histidine kinase [Ruminococcus sp.]